MRNLKLQYCKQVEAIISNAKFLLLDPNASRDSDVLYWATSSKLYSCATSGKNATVEELAEVPGIVGAEYLALDDEICIATEVGEVLVVNPKTRGFREGTYCDVGIKCMAWSPDQEVVAFITKTENVVVMTCTYDPIAEHALVMQCSGEGQFMNVGWGKKETQFHGSEGKAAAKQTKVAQSTQNTDELPQNIEISWRADGEFFAVSFVAPEVGRMFKVFNKEGSLCYTSEHSERSDNLQPPIAWRPSGTWIAVPQRTASASIVALFEKNGLRHRQFTLPFDLSNEHIHRFYWSPDSDILAIETNHAVAGHQKLYLYTISNYHWYLKQVLSFTADDFLAVCSWDNRIGEEKTLHVVTVSGNYSIYRWNFAIDKYERSGIVAVIDGPRLLLTDFSKTVIPPPMCGTELRVDSAINACALTTNDANELQVCVYDTDHQLHIFKSTSHAKLLLVQIKTLRMPVARRSSLPFTNIFWLNQCHLIATTAGASSSTVQLIGVDSDSDSSSTYKLESALQLPGIVSALAIGSVELGHFFAHTRDGKVMQISLRAGNTLKLECAYAQLEQPVDQLAWYTSLKLQTCGLVALRSNQYLYIEQQRIACDVTSFCLAGNYLVYTQLATLHFVRLSDRRLVDTRKIERGAKLVTTIANAARTVLQMPRGNLEAISPRVLSLELVGELLERGRYNDAIDMMRKQRINLNIVCDHNMCTFVQRLDAFLAEVTNPAWLNLFLTDLRNDDFTQTMYASNYRLGGQQYPPGFKIADKVVFLCENLCDRMEQSGEGRYLLPIITAYVRLNNVEKALAVVWEERKYGGVAGEMRAAEALKYLMLLVDVNNLYDLALGTYDFGLVLFVAERSQKDPREFLPFLNELKAYEPNYRHFRLDEYLKRYERALQHIAACGAEHFDEALAFVQRHKLYRRALQCYAENGDCYAQLCLKFADHLRVEGKLENASFMYERGGDMKQALLCAKHVLDWRRVLALALNDPTQSLDALAMSLIVSLQNSGRHQDAFELLKMYGSSFEKALRELIKDKDYLRAIFEARMRPTSKEESPDYLATLIQPDLVDYRNLLYRSLLEDQKLFVEYKQRLFAIRERQKARQLQGDFYADDADVAVDECDLLSDTTSMRSSRYTESSLGTGKTFRSSKNRRKHERKLLSLKPGNPFEDIALIDALHNLVVKLCTQQAHIHDTCKALLELRQDSLAASLHNCYAALLTELESSLDEIWIPELVGAGGRELPLTGPNINYAQLQNAQRFALIDPQKRIKPQLNKKIAWEHEILF